MWVRWVHGCCTPTVGCSMLACCSDPVVPRFMSDASLRSDDPGYDGQLHCTRDLSAVTGACLALRRETFLSLGGMEERLAVAWNDVDLCLRVRAVGLRVIWTPHAVLLHREAASRGLEAEEAAKLARFRREQALMQERWQQAMEVDPFLNPNLLASEGGPLVLGRPRIRRPWQRIM